MTNTPHCAHCDLPMTRDRIGWDGRAYCSEDCIRQAEQDAHDEWRRDRAWAQRDEFGTSDMGLWP